MSEVDTRFEPAEREALLAEVRNYLPGFLSSAAAEQPDPLGDVQELLNLTPADTDRLVSTHVLLSSEVRDFVAALEQGLRKPITSSVRPKEATQAVRGAIDWQATMGARALAGNDQTLYVIRPARRIFDTPENRALAWALQRLDRTVRASGFGVEEAGAAITDPQERSAWADALTFTQVALARARRVPWIRDIQPERPSPSTMRRLSVARTAFYGRLLPSLIRALNRWTEAPTPDDLTELLCRRWFRPRRDWQLFEVVIALRLARAIAEKTNARRKSRLLVGGAGGRSAFARFSLDDGGQIALWYQAWPGSLGADLHRAARDRQELRSGEPRPDLIVQRTGPAADLAVLELKASRSPSYLGSGLSQLLGYLAGRPAIVGQQPRGWLVAPNGAPFIAVDADAGEQLWMCHSSEVADRVVERFVSFGGA